MGHDCLWILPQDESVGDRTILVRQGFNLGSVKQAVSELIIIVDNTSVCPLFRLRCLCKSDRPQNGQHSRS